MLELGLEVDTCLVDVVHHELVKLVLGVVTEMLSLQLQHLFLPLFFNLFII